MHDARCMPCKALRRSVSVTSVDFGIKNIPGRAPAAHLENIHRAALAERAVPSPAEQLALIRAEKSTKRQATPCVCCMCML